jgi:hypothetical protein
VWACGARKPLYVPAWAVAVGVVVAHIALVTTLRAYRVY